jgi:hypothetical protein
MRENPEGDVVEANNSDITKTKSAVRNCYYLILGNTIWLLIPMVGLLTGNNISTMLTLMVTAGAVLFVSNNYIGKKWYYSTADAKDTVFESHLNNIDNIGFVVFFITMVAALIFLIATVLVLNIFKSQSGFVMFLIIDIAMSVVLGGLAFWVVKHAGAGLSNASKNLAYKYAKAAA